MQVRRLGSLGDLGIVPRLTIAFAAVAVLAAAANLIARSGAKMVHGDAPVIVPAPMIVRPPVPAAPPVEKPPAEMRVLTSEELLPALEDSTEAAIQALAQKFSANAAALKAAIPKNVTAPVPVAAASDTPAPVVENRPDTLVEAPPEDSPRSNRMWVAWIGGAVLLLLIYISYGTVRSIVQPVRRLLDATARLAKGEKPMPIPRGGIRELDNLAVAFNVMAQQLAAAQTATRDSHLLLEAKVEERTLQLQALAAHDPLTGLPNRRQLFALLDTAIERAEREQGHVGVFFLDVDNFKNINDSIGHEFGDHVLVSIAKRLQDVARHFGFAARLGGDEFTLVHERASSIDQIRDAGLGIVQAFQAPLEVEGRDLIVSVSLGVSIYPEHEQESEALLRAADAALFRAKALGRSQMALFTPELLAAAAAKFSIEQGLRRAIERSEFELFFQPEVCAETLQVRLVEALLRWRMPDGRYVAPGEFLAVAEESGLIIEIGDWVLRTAIQTAARWHRGAWPQARVAINVSPRQLLDYRFVERVQELLREYAVPPECIEIELTESVLQTGHATIEALKRLRATGLAIALDDFGTGYSSLASLEQLPLTRIKLDRSLIAGIDSNPRSAAIARAILSLCQGLGLEITAEGVERPEQFALLCGHRAMCMQGYLLARPAPADGLEAMMRTVQQQCEELLLLQKAAMPWTVVDLMPALPRRAAN